jgi:hypothetical protein
VLRVGPRNDRASSHHFWRERGCERSMCSTTSSPNGTSIG